MLYGTYLRLGLPVGASDIDVMRALRAKWKKGVRRDPALRDTRKATYRQILRYHQQARDLFFEVTRGTLGAE